MCVVLPRPPCWGYFQSPADPPRKSLSVPPYGGLATGFATSRRSYHDQKETAALLLDNLRAKGCRAPCNHDQGPSCPMDPDRCFGTGFDQRVISALPLDTHRPAPAMAQRMARSRAREEQTRKQSRFLSYGRTMDRKPKPKPKRTAPVSYRPPEGLREEFHTRVHNSGLSINSFITASVFGQAAPKSRRVASLDEQAAAALLTQAARIHDQLKALSVPSGEIWIDMDGTTVLQECRDELIEVRSCLLSALGRQP